MADVKDLLLALDEPTWGRVEDARENLLPLGPRIFPAALEVFSQIRGYRGRAALMHTAMKFALVRPEAVDLAILGLADRSGHVRYKACILLSVAGQHRALPDLRKLLLHEDHETAADARAAITAIENADRHLFLDRGRTGKVRLEIGGLADPGQDG